MFKNLHNIDTLTMSTTNDSNKWQIKPSKTQILIYNSSQREPETNHHWNRHCAR